MAEEKKDEKQEEATPETNAGAKRFSPLLIGGLLVAVVVLIGAPVLYFTLSSGGKEEKSKHEEFDQALVEQEYQKIKTEGYVDEDELFEDEEPLGAFFPFETFVVNLEKGGYLRCQIQVEFQERNISKRFLARLVLVRDALILLLSSQDKDDLLSDQGKESLKKDVLGTINQVLRKDEIKEVYFSQFVIQ